MIKLNLFKQLLALFLSFLPNESMIQYRELFCLTVLNKPNMQLH